MTRIACPVALHPDGGERRIAICLHPQAGPQLMKAVVGAKEDPTAAAARVLYVQSVLETRAVLPIGTAQTVAEDAEWHFALCRIVPPVRDRWQHLPKGETHPHQFIWMPLDGQAAAGFDDKDLRALEWIRATL